MKLELPVELVKKVLSYLQDKPFKEVAELIKELASLKPIEEKKED
jgi:hypothetical protein